MPETLNWMHWGQLFSAVCFVMGIKMLSEPERAKTGNLLSIFGMVLAVSITLYAAKISDFSWLLPAGIAGAALGFFASKMVKMTAMPQMVAIYNGLGGMASAFVALGEFLRGGLGHSFTMVARWFSLFIGLITATGSAVAFLKLQEWLKRNLRIPLHYGFCALLLLLAVLAWAHGFLHPQWAPAAFLAVALAASILGVLVVIPIGGADMPVVVALLNAYSGLAVSFTGFVLQNPLLVLVGALVGASGIFLTATMCKAMHRSLLHVVLGGHQAQGKAAEGSAGIAGKGPQGGQEVRAHTVEDVSGVLEAARSVIFVPGYGMAVAQAQHVVRELGDLLDELGVKVHYGIHPVAGRMPGHMNVLLAEANVSYDLLKDMEEINPEFRETDAVIVVGANDVVNPAARDNPDSPLYGMPVLHVEEAKTVIVLKRSMAAGFSGVDNELFLRKNTMMIFGNAKTTLQRLNEELQKRS